MQKLRAADLVAQRLYEAGCRMAFGMPGGEVLTIVDALEKAGIRFVLTKHENCAGFMAEGVMHQTGAPAILVATVGPGALNAVNVVENARQDRVPMIFLTGCVDETEALTYTHQVLDQQAVFRPVTKHSFRLTAEGADIVADKAVSIAMSPRRGPVHIDVPIGVADALVTSAKLRRRAPALPTMPQDLSAPRAWLETAQRPVMIAGLDILAEGSDGAVRDFCTRHNVPLVTTYKAKGVLPEDHALALGGAGLSPLADRHLLPFVQAADLIICAGYDPIEMRTGWREVWDPSAVNVLDISAEENLHYMHQATCNIVGHVGATLGALSQGVEPRATWADGEVAHTRAALAAAFPCDEDWGPGAVMDECRSVMPDGTVATADSGAHRILLSQMWPCEAPGGLLQSSALCTMACAIPLAIGAKLAAPERQVIAFSGDAGALMCIGELSTAAELGGNPIFVVFVDACLSLIELKQRQRQLANNGVDFGEHDFAAIGKAFGGHGVTVGNRTDLRAALERAKTADRFTVIAAVIDKGAYDGRI